MAAVIALSEAERAGAELSCAESASTHLIALHSTPNFLKSPSIWANGQREAPGGEQLAASTGMNSRTRCVSRTRAVAGEVTAVKVRGWPVTRCGHLFGGEMFCRVG